MSIEELEKQIIAIVNSGETKDYKSHALAELSSFDNALAVLPACCEIVSMYPDFNNVAIRLKMGEIMEQHLFVSLDYLRKHPEDITLIAETVDDLMKRFSEYKEDK